MPSVTTLLAHLAARPHEPPVAVPHTTYKHRRYTISHLLQEPSSGSSQDILDVASGSGVDVRVIFAVVLQESTYQLLAITTNRTVHTQHLIHANPTRRIHTFVAKERTVRSAKATP